MTDMKILILRLVFWVSAFLVGTFFFFGQFADGRTVRSGPWDIIDTQTMQMSGSTITEKNGGAITIEASGLDVNASMTVQEGLTAEGSLVVVEGSTLSETEISGPLRLQGGSEGTAGHVWTSTDVNGTGQWSAPAGGGGDLWSDPVDSNIVPDATGTRNLGFAGSNTFFNQTLTNEILTNAISIKTVGNQASGSFTRSLLEGGNGTTNSGKTYHSSLRLVNFSSGQLNNFAIYSDDVAFNNSGGFIVETGDTADNDPGDQSGEVFFKTGNAPSIVSGNITLETGSGLTSGDVVLETGTATGTRGSIELNAPSVKIDDIADVTDFTNSTWWSPSLPSIVIDGTTPNALSAFGAGFNFKGDGDNAWFLMTTEEQSVTAPSSAMYIWTGRNTGTGDTGEIYLQSGPQQGASGDTGKMWFFSGTSNNGNSGELQLNSGNAGNGNSGTIDISTGNVTTGTSGSINLSVGNATGGTEGIITMDGRVSLGFQSNIAVTADNQVVTPLGAFLNVLSDSVTATDRTFTIANGTSGGQVFTMIFADATDAVELLNTGNVRLSADWTPNFNDSISLVWSGSAWIEVSRTDDGGGGGGTAQAAKFSLSGSPIADFDPAAAILFTAVDAEFDTDTLIGTNVFDINVAGQYLICLQVIAESTSTSDFALGYYRVNAGAYLSFTPTIFGNTGAFPNTTGCSAVDLNVNDTVGFQAFCNTDTPTPASGKCIIIKGSIAKVGS